MSHLYLNEESDNSEDIMWQWSLSLHHSSTISVWAWTEKMCGSKSHESASAADLLHIRIGNLDWSKCEHCKNEATEIDCLCCLC